MIHAILISYWGCQKMEDLQNRLLGFIRKKISHADPSINLEEINSNTDLINLGVESIIIASLIGEIEDEFKINISLDIIEQNNFAITPKIILESLNDKKS